MHVFDEPKIDCHVHVLDPARFPYRQDVAYRPAGQEIATEAQLRAVMQTYGVTHALLVQPNSGYEGDNSCMLDAIALSEGHLKGIAIVNVDADAKTLRQLKERGILGVAVNATFHGTDYYKDADRLLRRLADEDMLLNLQIEGGQLALFAPWIESTAVKVLIDHLGRPRVREGIDDPAFKLLLRLAGTGCVFVKLSGYAKFSGDAHPFEDCWPFVRAVVGAYGLERCLWASDWPFLRSGERQDYGPLVDLARRLFPDPNARRQLFWDTPSRLFGFAERSSNRADG
jgi:predicted TIM-barrel fold metal-dependent hydrolase